MKTALDFIVDLRNSKDLCDALDKAISTIDRDDPEQCLQAIVEVGAACSYRFTAKEYKLAAEEYSRNRTANSLKDITTNPTIMGPWTTGGASCIAHCPTRSDVCIERQ